MKNTTYWLAAVLGLFAVIPAHADSVVYSVTGAGQDAGLAFQYTAPAFFTILAAQVPASAVVGFTCPTSDPGCTLNQMFFDPHGFNPNNDEITVETTPAVQFVNGQIFLFFPIGAFGAVGTYSDSGGNGTLTVSVQSAPEPSSLLLLGTGLLGLALLARRRVWVV